MPDFHDRVARFDKVVVLAETDKAIKCVVDGQDVWIPQSQIDDSSEVFSLATSGGELVVSQWIAEQKGLV